MNEQRGIVFDPLHQALAPYTAKGFGCSWRRGLSQEASEALIKHADHLAELFDFDAEVGMQEAVVPDLDEAFGQDVHQVAPNELHDVQRQSSPFGGTHFLVFEGDGLSVVVEDAGIADGDAGDVGAEVFEGAVSLSDVLAVDDPVGFVPDLGRYLCAQSGACEGLAHSVSEQDGERPDVYEEVSPAAFPCRAVFGESAPGHDEVGVGMVLHLASPGVQDAEESGMRASDKPLVGLQRAQGVGGLGKQGVVDLAREVHGDFPDFIGQGEGDHEVRGRQETKLLLVYPVGGALVLAGRAVPVSAGRDRDMAGPAARTGVLVIAAVPGSAALDGADDFGRMPVHGMPLHERIGMGMKDGLNEVHANTPLISWLSRARDSSRPCEVICR